MDSPKRNIKSSNSHAPVKREVRKQKKSLSNGEVPTKIMKKRGVYVEKKSNKMPTEGKRVTRNPVKPFDEAADIEMILSSLSQSYRSSLSFQDPSTDYLRDERTQARIATGTRTFGNDITDTRGVFIEEIKTKGTSVEKKVHSEVKYIMESQDNSLVEVMQSSERLIIQTPSMYAETTVLSKCGNNDSTSDDGRESIKSVVEQAIYNNIAEKLTEAVFDRKQIATKRKKDNCKKSDLEQPVTLVGACENTDSLYNLFLDLLKNTISIYNIATDYAHNGQNDSNTAIKEKHVKKVNAKKKSAPKTKGTTKPTNNMNNIDTNSKCDRPLSRPVEKVSKSTSPATPPSENPPSIPSKKRKKMKTRNSTCIPYLTNNVYPVINMTDEPTDKPQVQRQRFRKQTSRRKNKNSFLNSIKSHLQQDLLTEPQNLFEALVVLAKSKRKRLRFQPEIRVETDVSSNTDAGSRKRNSILKRKKSGYVSNHPTGSTFWSDDKPSKKDHNHPLEVIF